MRLFYRFCGFFVRVIMKLLWHYTLVNKENLQGINSAIIACNHTSWFDPPFIGAVIPFEIGILAKAELFKNRFFRALITTLNAIPVERHKADMGAITACKNLLDTGKSLLLFPQGTRHGKNIKPGVGLFAMQMQREILPIYIENADKFLLCFLFIRRMKIVVGKPIKIDYFKDWEQTKESYQRLAEHVYANIMELRYA